MQIRCNCGKVRAELAAFPARTPGRLKCYCDDCQMFALHIGRQDVLDAAGGTEVIPVYPSDVTLVSGAEHLRCTRLSPKGLYRWSTTCCNSPFGNTAPGSPWLGIQRNMFTASDPGMLDRTLGAVKSGIFGKFATGPVPPGTPAKMNLKAAIPVLPFMLKGALGRKGKRSPFFRDSDLAPIVPPRVLTDAERQDLRKRWEAHSRR